MSCEEIQAYNRKERKARKTHKCCECLTAIKPGEKYQYHSGVLDGRGLSFKQCLFCSEMYREVMAEARYVEEGPAFEGLLEYLTECEDQPRLAAFEANRNARNSKGPTT